MSVPDSQTGAASPLAADAALAAALVRDAGQLAARMRAGGPDDLGTTQKTSVSDLVTDADRGAERLVTDRLGTERPHDGLLGEEGSQREGTSGRRWVIDPVDGTWNFVHGLDWWCSALALVGRAHADGEDVLLGAVHHPATGRTFLGGPALAGSCDGRPLDRLPDTGLERACVSAYLHPPFHGTPVGAAFARAVRPAAALRMLGSGSMDATAVARGAIGVTLQHSVPPWDRLPGAALIRSVGGVAAQVDAAGKTWSVAGAPTAVAQVCEALAAGE